MVVSLAIVSIIMGAMGSIIVLATRALPTGKAYDDLLVDAAGALERFASELAYATDITDASHTTITFTVPDRDTDGIDETIRYAWAGIVGEPLTRTYNGVSANLVDNVSSLGIGYAVAIGTREEQTGGGEGPEQTLHAYQGAQNGSESIKPRRILGETFAPTLPVGTISWSVTRVSIHGQQLQGADGSVVVQIQEAAADHTPSGVVLWERIVDESELPESASWFEMLVGGVTGLEPSQQLCLLISNGSGNKPGEFSIASGITTMPGSYMLYSINDGSSWDVRSESAMLHRVEGTATTAANTETVEYQLLLRADVSLTVGDAPKADAYLAIRTLNRPEVQ
jgi:hypothetical protein